MRARYTSIAISKSPFVKWEPTTVHLPTPAAKEVIFPKVIRNKLQDWEMICYYDRQIVNEIKEEKGGYKLGMLKYCLLSNDDQNQESKRTDQEKS